jgi:hypothetical protein
MNARTSLRAAAIFAVVSVTSIARADEDYYRAFDRADASIRTAHFDDARAVILTALHKYPGDFALTLELAWVEYRAGNFDRSEHQYRIAGEISDGSLDARLGIGWSLIQQDRCDEGIHLLQAVLAEEDDVDATRGLWVCADRKRFHATVWGSLGGSLYTDHPWLHTAGAAFIGANLRPTRALAIGAAYRLTRLVPTDARIPPLTQHEVYLSAGYTGKHVDLVAEGALIWGGDQIVGGSRHGGALLRWKYPTMHISEASVEAAGNFYSDLWMLSLAPSVTLTFGNFSLTANGMLQRFTDDTFASVSLTPSLTLGGISLWLGARYGIEYRTAYLSQFGVFNAQDRSPWAAFAGTRIQLDPAWALLVNYALLGLESRDGLRSTLHSLSAGPAVSF